MIIVEQQLKRVGEITEYVVRCEYPIDVEKFMSSMRYVRAKVR